jgi:hypothetical protein
MNVSEDSVELRFLDMPDAPDSVRSFETIASAMSDKARYGFVSDRP